MRGANPENSRFAGSSELSDQAWLSIPEILERLVAAGVDVTERQLERWREANLLPAGVQEIARPGHGSAYRYPPETVDLAIAIRQMQAEKNDLVWIGWELWWRGYNVPDGCWRLELVMSAKKYDRYFRYIRRRVSRERSDFDTPNLSGTLADEAAPGFNRKGMAGSVLASRIVGRIELVELPTVIRIILETASGIEPEYEPAPQPDELPADQHLLFKAMDLGTLKVDRLNGDESFVDDQIGGHQLELRKAMPGVLRDIAAGIRNGTCVEAANASRSELETARDDIKCALDIAQALYQSTKWIYGETAFGLRFANWAASKAKPEYLRAFVLIWLQMRRAGGEFYSPAEIRLLHSQTMEMALDSQSLKALSVQEGELSKALNPKYLKMALTGKMPFEEFVRKVQSAKIKSSFENPHVGNAT
jgi:hypothetical protein